MLEIRVCAYAKYYVCQMMFAVFYRRRTAPVLLMFLARAQRATTAGLKRHLSYAAHATLKAHKRIRHRFVFILLFSVNEFVSGQFGGARETLKRARTHVGVCQNVALFACRASLVVCVFTAARLAETRNARAADTHTHTYTHSTGFVAVAQNVIMPAE